eukprot:3233089-Rhodomonas_salina.1
MTSVCTTQRIPQASKEKRKAYLQLEHSWPVSACGISPSVCGDKDRDREELRQDEAGGGHGEGDALLVAAAPMSESDISERKRGILPS